MHYNGACNGNLYVFARIKSKHVRLTIEENIWIFRFVGGVCKQIGAQIRHSSRAGFTKSHRRFKEINQKRTQKTSIIVRRWREAVSLFSNFFFFFLGRLKLTSRTVYRIVTGVARITKINVRARTITKKVGKICAWNIAEKMNSKKSYVLVE